MLLWASMMRSSLLVLVLCTIETLSAPPNAYDSGNDAPAYNYGYCEPNAQIGDICDVCGTCTSAGLYDCGNNTGAGGVPVYCQLKCVKGTPCPSVVVPNGWIVTINLVTLRLVCKNGFVLYGPGEFVCNADGTLSPSPAYSSCQPVSCDPAILTSDPNGQFLLVAGSPSSIVSGNMYRLQCIPGYASKFDIILICDGDGFWRSKPLPEFPLCKQVCESPSHVENGYFDPKKNVYYIGDEITVICDDGYEVSSTPANLTCLESEWVGTPPTCSPNKCKPVPSVENGHYTNTSNPGDEYRDTQVLACEIGYVPKDCGNVNIICIDGCWSPVDLVTWPTCVLVCEPLPGVDFGCFFLNGNVHTAGATANLTCSTGYQPSSQAQIECGITGDWPGNLPTCVPDSCGIPTPDPAGMYVLTSNPGTNVGDTAVLKCNRGYKVSGGIDDTGAIYCDLMYVSWTTPPPTCVKICDRLPAEPSGRGWYIYDTQGTHTVGSTATLKCCNGSETSTVDIQITCQVDGSWTHSTGDLECVQQFGDDFGDHCSDTEGCGGYDNSDCNADGICVCQDGYFWDQGFCYKKSAENDNDCPAGVCTCTEPNTECNSTTSKCDCKVGYTRSDGKCKAPLGAICHDACQDDNAECKENESCEKMCRCKDGYYNSEFGDDYCSINTNGQCLPQKDLLSPCDGKVDECKNPDVVECVGGYCMCKNGYSDDGNGTCIQTPKDLGDTCTCTDVCQPPKTTYCNATSNTCECKPGYEQVGDACVKTGPIQIGDCCKAAVDCAEDKQTFGMIKCEKDMNSTKICSPNKVCQCNEANDWIQFTENGVIKCKCPDGWIPTGHQQNYRCVP